MLECVGLKDALVQDAGVVRDGGVAPARAYMEELMPHIDGYRLMNDREALKVLVRP